jgi:type II secretory pathway component GspD/PulD (secretin)
LFRSESSQSAKKNLMIFVTPTIIDPAGNRLHSDEDMPFARVSVPVQPAPAAVQ